MAGSLELDPPFTWRMPVQRPRCRERVERPILAEHWNVAGIQPHDDVATGSEHECNALSVRVPPVAGNHGFGARGQPGVAFPSRRIRNLEVTPNGEVGARSGYASRYPCRQAPSRSAELY